MNLAIRLVGHGQVDWQRPAYRANSLDSSHRYESSPRPRYKGQRKVAQRARMTLTWVMSLVAVSDTSIDSRIHTEVAYSVDEI
jgi:hypothetical protein